MSEERQKVFQDNEVNGVDDIGKDDSQTNVLATSLLVGCCLGPDPMTTTVDDEEVVQLKQHTMLSSDDVEADDKIDGVSDLDNDLSVYTKSEDFEDEYPDMPFDLELGTIIDVDDIEAASIIDVDDFFEASCADLSPSPESKGCAKFEYDMIISLDDLAASLEQPAGSTADDSSMCFADALMFFEDGTNELDDYFECSCIEETTIEAEAEFAVNPKSSPLCFPNQPASVVNDTTYDGDSDGDQTDSDEEDKDGFSQAISRHQGTGLKLVPLSRINRLWRRLATHWRNSKVAVIWAFLYLGANVAAFTVKALQYHNNRADALSVFGSCVMVARGAANCLNLNCALILLPMSRSALTKVRGFHKISALLLPFDSMAPIHRVIGCAIAFWTIVHVAAHLGDFHRFSYANEADIVALFNGKLGMYTVDDVPESPVERLQLVLQTPAAITGVIMVSCMIVAYGCIILQSRLGYNAFWYTHHLLLVMMVALAFHGTGSLLEPFESIYWLAFPLVLYGVPRLWRECVCNRPLQVLDLRLKEGGNVVFLRLSKPASLSKGRLQAGVYFNLNIPSLSRFEWHPFSITSAPSDDFLDFHIQKVGDWTGRLCSMAGSLEQIQTERDQKRHASITSSGDTDPTCQNSFSRSCSDESLGGRVSAFEQTLPKPHCKISLKVYVEGPLGAPSQGFDRFRVLVLCGGGVGATPMISVIKELLRNRGKMERTYFFWTFRDMEALEWFASLLDEVFFANTDSSRSGREMFVTRLFLTSEKTTDRPCFVHRSSSMRQIELEDSRVEHINPHYVVRFGRPHWVEELSVVQEEAKLLGQRKAGVFVCGSHTMARAIHRSTVKLSKKDPAFHFYCRQETFCSS